jgi:uncharacterized protein (TIGR02453 family)
VSLLKPFAGFPAAMPRFFRQLNKNNQREWFQPRKEHYQQQVLQPMTELVQAVNQELSKIAPEYVTDPKKAIFRIYRDTRFSPDKTPYKTHIGAFFVRRGLTSGAAGLYMHVSAKDIYIGGGLYHPEREVLLTVREHVRDHYGELRKILSQRKLKALLGDLRGDCLTRAPKGFDPEHPAADLIKHKDWLLAAELEPAVATTPRIYPEILSRFRLIIPFVEFFNRALSARKKAKEPLGLRL